MSDKKDPSNSLRDRFKSRNDRARSRSGSADEADATGVTDSTNVDEPDSGGSDSSERTADADRADEGEPSVRERKQVAMYLPDDLREEIQRAYDELDAKSKLAGNGGIEKHKDFFEGFVRAALQNEDLPEFVGVSDE
ncbi:hypothetical protein [Halegenticoccus tardaugens]|uniref:hypothetical protein n=1 Tax=Halegenticoccus tardaugens TaxID=2071624 RepID=UPI00100A9B02|nr:hypothetical protein [Halegenticoccus tardaugens]